MKWYQILGVIVAICVAITAPPSFVSAQGAEEKTQMKESQGSQDQSKMQKYKKELQKELKAIDKKIAALEKKAKKEGSKLKGEAKESWDDLKAKQTVAKNKLKDVSSCEQGDVGKSEVRG